MVTRKYPRFPVSLSSTLVHKDRLPPYGINPGSFGQWMLCGEYHQPLYRHAAFRQLHIPGESKPIVIDNAAVRWSGSAGIGLEFLTVAPPHQDRLDRMIQRSRTPATPQLKIPALYSTRTSAAPSLF